MEYQINIYNLSINYKLTGKGEPVVLLHGWGCDLGIFKNLQTFLTKNFKVYSLDLPGFGKSDPPPTAWGTKQYTNIVKTFLIQLQIEKPIILGHSFGGRIAIQLAVDIQLNKLILVGSAGIKPLRKINYYLKVYFFKILKQLFSLPVLNHYKEHILDSFKKRFASKDYQNACDVMRGTLIKVVNEDLKKIMRNIDISVLLIWGENDTATPLRNAKTMNRLIANSGLVILENTGHYVFLERANQFYLIIDSFLQNDKTDL